MEQRPVGELYGAMVEREPRRPRRRVLVVVGEPEIRRLLQAVLAEAGFSVDVAGSGENALQQAWLLEPEAVVLDLTLPDMSGLNLCRELRATSPVPILIVSSIAAVQTKVQALNLGADDYVTIPFDIEEFLARLRAVIRRASSAPSTVLVAGELQLNQATGQVLRGGQELRLTPIEYQLLRYLMANAGRVISYSELIRTGWGMQWGGNRTMLRVFVAQLRRKIEPDPDHPTYIHTVARIGYRFETAG